MSNLKADTAALTKSVTKAWTAAKRKADLDERVSQNQLERMLKPARVTIKEAAFAVMESAYNKASSNGQYYANARQIMYAARPAILEQCDVSSLDSKYFTQTLLKDYLEEFNPDWRVVWDARGHLVEPHTKANISLGGLGVMRYRDKWGAFIDIEMPGINSRVSTHGPRHRFSSVLFIEKEGFAEILAHTGISERYDIAIMSTKGIPVDAACNLIGSMASEGVRVFVLHDFDLAGFKILRTLRVGTRLSQGTDVIDLGLRMADIGDLSPEPVSYSQRQDPKIYLEHDCGATDEEARFLVSGGRSGRWSGLRVEINAMTSEQLITWLERKFSEHEVKKLVPDEDTLSTAYQRAVFLQRMEEEIEQLREMMEGDEIPTPNGLGARVEAMLRRHPRMSWDQALWRVAREEAA